MGQTDGLIYNKLGIFPMGDSPCHLIYRLLATASGTFTGKDGLWKVVYKWVAVISHKPMDLSEFKCTSQGWLGNAAVTNLPSSVA